MFPVISVVGWHNTGKTTIVEELVRTLKARALKVATVKHAHLAPSLDQPGTDTFRYAEAGSALVGLVSHDLTTFAYPSQEGAELADVLKWVPPNMDLVIIEGYKRSTLPKIEVCEPGRPRPIAEGVEELAVTEKGASTDEVVADLIQELVARGLIEEASGT